MPPFFAPMTTQQSDEREPKTHGCHKSCKNQLALGAFASPAIIRSGVNGASRRRTPTASKIALAMAAAIGALEGSPPPRAGISGRLIKTISISGMSGNLRMG